MTLWSSAALDEVRSPTPECAVVFQREGVFGNYQVTVHPLEERATGLAVLPGRAMASADARALLLALAGERRAGFAWAPTQVIAQGDERIAWFVPGAVRPMLFRQGDGRVLRLTVPWPSLLFDARPGGVRIAALGAPRRPRARTRLYHAPLWNTSESGEVCLGSATVPALDGLEALAGYEAAIFESAFSHGNFRGNLRTGDGGRATSDAEHVRFWRGLAASGAQHFPKDALVPMGQSVAAFLGLKA